MAKAAFLLAATHSGGGKTTIAMGLMRAFSKLGHTVQPFKVGPDYIDPMYHSTAAGRCSRNLDSFMVPEETIPYLFAKNSADADIAIVEGVMGLYDGADASTIKGSSAHIAQLLDLPVILVIDGNGMALSAAALVKGFQNFAPETRFGGVILNHIKKDSSFLYLKEIIEDNCGLPVFGYLPENPVYALNSRHLGLLCSGEIGDLDNKLDTVAQALIEHVDLAALTAAAARTSAAAAAPKLPRPLEAAVRIGYAYDDAFNFYYQDSLDLLADLGAVLVPFSPLRDSLPPAVDGLIFGGGYPELHLKELAANVSFRESLKALLEAGQPCYAECGGLIYLGKNHDHGWGKPTPLTGFFPFDFEMTDRLQHFGYMTAEIGPDTLFSGDRPAVIRGHEFHFTKRVDTVDFPTAYAVTKRRKEKEIHWEEGFYRKNTLGGYPHFHFYSNPDCAAHFLTKALEYQRKQK